MRWSSLPLLPNGTPAMLNDRWMLRISSNRHAPATTHELDVRLEEATPPTVPVDFLWAIWRVRAGGRIHMHPITAQLPLSTTPGPGQPGNMQWSVLVADAAWRTTRGRERYGVVFWLEILPVWRPKPSS